MLFNNSFVAARGRRSAVSIFALVLAGLGGSASAGAAAVAPEELARKFNQEGVELAVEEPVGLERRAEPVTSGVPLPKGAVQDPARLALYGPASQGVPCDFTALGRWPDGSVKWVLLDFQADVPAKGKAAYRLKPGAPAALNSGAARVQEAGAVVTVTAGDLSFTVNKSAAGLIESLKYGGKDLIAAANPLQVVLTSADGKAFRAGKPETVTVESKGPLRATVLVSGKLVGDAGAVLLGGKAGYDLRVTAWANKPALGLAFTLKNQGFYGYENEKKHKEWLFFKSLKLDVPLEAKSAAVRSARLAGKDYPLAAGQAASLVQWYKYPARDARGFDQLEFAKEQEREAAGGMAEENKGWYYLAGPAGAKPDAGAKADGAVEAALGADLFLNAAARRFRENFPRGFEVRPDRLGLLIWPEGGFWPRTKEAGDAATYQFEGGREKTAEFVLWLDRRAGTSPDGCRALDHPLAARAPAAWHRDAGAVWPLAPAAAVADEKDGLEVFSRYERLQRAKVDAEAGDEAGEPFPGWGDQWKKVSIPSLWERCPDIFQGWMNYGDLIWSFGYCSLHYDWPYAMQLQYLRTGERRCLDVGEDMVRHRQDIDQYHVGNTGAWLAFFQRYEKGEHGHLPRQEDGYKQFERKACPSHTWNRGLLLHWALTGDPRSLAAAKEVGQAYKNHFYGQHKLDQKDKMAWGEFRTPGWAIDSWLALYEYTGDKQCLAMSQEMFKKTLLAMEKDNGSQGHIIKDGRQGSQFLSYCIEPLCRLHYLTGDQEVLGFLRRVLDYERKSCLRGGTTEGGKYTPLAFVEHWELADESDKMASVLAYNLGIADGYAYLYRASSRKEDLELAQRLFRDSIFYYGAAGSCAASYRTPLGFHYQGRPMGPCEKMLIGSSRYGQIYLLVEQDSGVLVGK